MKMFYLVIPLILLIQSCDVPRIFEVEVSDKPNVSVSIYADNKYFKNWQSDEGKKVLIQLPKPDDKSHRDTLFLYGLGASWSEESLQDFSNCIDSIVIVGSKKELHLNDQVDIYNFLKRNKKSRKRLSIKVK